MDDLDGLDLLLEFRRPGPFVALEAELDILGRKGIPLWNVTPWRNSKS